MLVLDGAPLERTVTGALWAAFAGGGRHRAAVGRLVVVPSVAEPLLRGARGGRRAPAPRRPAPPRHRGRPAALARDPRARRGAGRRGRRRRRRRCCAAARSSVPGVAGAFYAPAVLRGVPPGARLLREPVPGPVLAVVEAGNEEEAIALATGRPGRLGVGGRPRPRRARRARRSRPRSRGSTSTATRSRTPRCGWPATSRRAASPRSRRGCAPPAGCPTTRSSCAPRPPPRGSCTAARPSASACCAPARCRSRAPRSRLAREALGR